MSDLVTLDEILAAKQRLRGVAVRTPLYRLERARLRAAKLPEPDFDIYIKAENEQPIGSFKLRGAYNMVAQLSPKALRRGVITYSSGNHAQGVAYAARALGAKAVIVMPDNTPEIKKAATKALGAEIVTVGPSSSERHARAEELARQYGYVVIPPYDAAAIIAGQATCAMEILEQLPTVDLIVAPVSGGGLLGGTGAAVKLTAPAVQVWGAEPELAADAKESFEARRLVTWPAEKTTRTIGDGLRTQSLGSLNFEHVMAYVDGIVTITEAEILSAMRALLVATKLVPEPSGAVALGAALYHAHDLPRVRKVAVVLSGGNLEPELRRTLEQR
jgi:threonine dehydratase